MGKIDEYGVMSRLLPWSKDPLNRKNTCRMCFPEHLLDLSAATLPLKFLLRNNTGSALLLQNGRAVVIFIKLINRLA